MNANSLVNFDFGRITNDNIRISMYGLAVKSVSGNYVSFDADKHAIMDVDILNIPANDFLYKMPAALGDVKPNDVIIVNRVPMYVMEVHESSLKVMDIREQTEKEVYPTKSPFGFNFVTRVVNLFDMLGGTATASDTNPFGNMLPLMMLSKDGGDNSSMLAAMLMSNGVGGNSMMRMFLMQSLLGGGGLNVDTNTLLLLGMMGGATGEGFKL